MWFPKCHLLLLVRHPNCYSRLCCRKSAESRSQSRVPTGLGRTVVAIHDLAMTSGRLECPAMFSSFFTDIYAYYFQYIQHNDEAYTSSPSRPPLSTPGTTPAPSHLPTPRNSSPPPIPILPAEPDFSTIDRERRLKKGRWAELSSQDS